MRKLARNIIVAVTLCAVLISGVISAAALSTKNQENEETVKEETVYVMAGADGSVQKIIVSEWLKNGTGSDRLSDRSSLTDIENVKGDESYTLSSDGMLIWDAQGNDIYYQGNTEQELPVGMSISYKLDGKTVTAEELAGKSGNVTIRFDYTNRQYETVEIDGKQEKIYVPFAMLTGMLLDSDNFRNVQVSNGKLVNDGEHTIAVGLAFPGLQDNLNISREKLEIPDYVEITADVTDFSLGTTVTIATNEILNGVDESKLDGIDDSSLGELSDAMSQLMDGSSSLYDGLCTLLDKSNELVNGVNQLADGAKSLQSGADSLADGAETLESGAADLSAGLDKLSANSASLNSGAAQVFNTLLSTATAQIRSAGIDVQTLTISNYAQVLSGVISSLDETTVYNQALQQVTEAVEAKRPEITEAVTAAVREQVSAQVTAAAKAQVTSKVTEAVQTQVKEQVINTAVGMSKDEYDAAAAAGLVSEEQQAAVETAINEQLASEAVSTTISDAVAAQMESEEIQSSIASQTDTQMESETVQATITQNVEAQVQQAISENMASDAVQSQISAASEGAQSVISLKTSLDSYNAFYLGLLSYTSGVDSAATGAGKLNTGATELQKGSAKIKAGASSLYEGVLSLKNGLPALVSGTTQLRDGSMELSDGLKQLNEEGIQKLVDLIDGDVQGLLTRLKATMDVSKDYCNFAGIDSSMSGQVKFIYRTDEVKGSAAQ